jgi:hypothetical protein
MGLLILSFNVCLEDWSNIPIPEELGLRGQRTENRRQMIKQKTENRRQKTEKKSAL